MRRFRILVDGLPSSARVYNAEMGQWTRGDHFDALTIEFLDRIHRDLLWLGRVKPSKMPRPFTIRRPWTPKPKKNAWIREWAAHATGRRR